MKIPPVIGIPRVNMPRITAAIQIPGIHSHQTEPKRTRLAVTRASRVMRRKIPNDRFGIG